MCMKSCTLELCKPGTRSCEGTRRRRRHDAPTNVTASRVSRSLETPGRQCVGQKPQVQMTSQRQQLSPETLAFVQGVAAPHTCTALTEPHAHAHALPSCLFLCARRTVSGAPAVATCAGGGASKLARCVSRGGVMRPHRRAAGTSSMHCAAAGSSSRHCAVSSRQCAAASLSWHVGMGRLRCDRRRNLRSAACC